MNKLTKGANRHTRIIINALQNAECGGDFEDLKDYVYECVEDLPDWLQEMICIDLVDWDLVSRVSTKSEEWNSQFY